MAVFSLKKNDCHVGLIASTWCTIWHKMFMTKKHSRVPPSSRESQTVAARRTELETTGHTGSNWSQASHDSTVLDLSHGLIWMVCFTLDFKHRWRESAGIWYNSHNDTQNTHTHAQILKYGALITAFLSDKENAWRLTTDTFVLIEAGDLKGQHVWHCSSKAKRNLRSWCVCGTGGDAWKNTHCLEQRWFHPQRSSRLSQREMDQSKSWEQRERANQQSKPVDGGEVAEVRGWSNHGDVGENLRLQ